MNRIGFVFALLALLAAPGFGDTASGPVPSSGVHGGLVVELGCGDGTRTASLLAGDSYCVHGLDTDAGNVKKARRHLQSLGLYGKVSVDTFDGVHLPYVDNMVNLLVAEHLGDVTEAEVMRVLVPHGVALINGKKMVKPWPANIDQWTHYLHDADNNAVANDTVVGPPRRLQWQGGPKWTRHHDRMSSLSALVSTGGRLFYILDEGSTASIYLPSHWSLVARDGFNGKILWKRKLGRWYSRLKGLKSGPADAPRRLIAAGNRVYVTLSLDGPLTRLDAVTGDTLAEYKGTGGAEEVLFSDGVLFVLIGPGSLVDGRRAERPAEVRTIIAIDAESGDALWRTRDVVAATTMAVDDQHVYYFNFAKRRAVGLSRDSGKLQWSSEPLPTPAKQTSFFASRLVVRDHVVLFAGGEFSGMTKSGGGETRSDTLTALSSETGRTLWTAKHPPSGYSSPENLFVIDGTVWCDSSSNGKLDGTLIGRDLHSGQLKHKFPADRTSYWFHHRCYPGRATSNYIMTSRTGIEFIDFRKQQWDLNHWTRGACLYGIMPCNGLVYTPPSPCICYAETMLHSFNAFAPAGGSLANRGGDQAERREQGPAFGQPVGGKASAGDWPTYRATNSRSGASSTRVPAQLTHHWQAAIGGRLSSLTIAAGRVFVTSVDQHTVYALDGESGQRRWQYTAGGRVDSPPTYFEGHVLFGSADGWVYCLRADDGALIWRLRAGPADRRIMSHEQIESLWPVHGSVLVRNGIAHFVAGRSLFVDGGMRLYRVDAKTGELVSKTVLDKHNPNTGGDIQQLVKWLNMPVGRPDILSCDGQRLYMRSQQFDLQGKRLAIGPKTSGRQEGSLQGGEGTHLFCPTGLLDDSWFHRTYWLYATTWGSGWNGYFVAGKYAPAGKILCVGEDTVYGFGRQPRYYKWTTPMEFRLFAAHKRWQGRANQTDQKQRRRGQLGPVGNQANYRWVTNVPILVRAMALADQTLFIAGPPDVLDESSMRAGIDGRQKAVLDQQSALDGRAGGVLWAVSAQDGKKLAGQTLESPPTFDGMAAARGRLYVTTVDGHLHCFGP